MSPELDVYFKLEDDVYVWNSGKAKENRQKHGIRFEEACEVFLDPNHFSTRSRAKGEETV